MNRLWSDVDRYFAGLLAPPDAALQAALDGSAAAGLPAIAVSANQGKLLHLLALAIGARRILEIGTLGGYSAIWLGRALPEGGTLISLELDPKHAAVARANLARAGLESRCEVREGAALDVLAALETERQPPFDLVFIDADKPNNPRYFECALRLARVGSLIVVDNVVREGRVLDAASRDEAIQGVRRLAELMASERRVSATVMQSVGEKGHDGFALALVVAD